MGCEHSKSSFPTSDFPSLTSNFTFVTFHFSFCKCLTSITLIPPLNTTPLILVFFNENHNMTPLNNSTSHLSTYHMKWDIGNEKWETRCGKWEFGSGKWEVGSEGAEKQERCWIGPWEVGNETQTRILIFEVTPSWERAGLKLASWALSGIGMLSRWDAQRARRPSPCSFARSPAHLSISSFLPWDDFA